LSADRELFGGSGAVTGTGAAVKEVPDELQLKAEAVARVCRVVALRVLA
jgi:hypothetical protein